MSIKVTWAIEDGEDELETHVLEIDESEVEDLCEDDLHDYIEQAVQNVFEETVGWVIKSVRLS